MNAGNGTTSAPEHSTKQPEPASHSEAIFLAGCFSIIVLGGCMIIGLGIGAALDLGPEGSGVMSGSLAVFAVTATFFGTWLWQRRRRVFALGCGGLAMVAGLLTLPVTLFNLPTQGESWVREVAATPFELTASETGTSILHPALELRVWTPYRNLSEDDLRVEGDIATWRFSSENGWPVIVSVTAYELSGEEDWKDFVEGLVRSVNQGLEDDWGTAELEESSIAPDDGHATVLITGGGNYFAADLRSGRAPNAAGREPFVVILQATSDSAEVAQAITTSLTVGLE